METSYVVMHFCNKASPEKVYRGHALTMPSLGESFILYIKSKDTDKMLVMETTPVTEIKRLKGKEGENCFWVIFYTKNSIYEMEVCANA
jgi:hypothetical protein